MADKNPSAVDVLVGQNIRLGRLQMGLSQTELGARIGVSSQQIHKYEKGTNRIGASRLQQIAVIFRLPVAALFDGAPSAGHEPAEQTPRYLLAKPHALRLLNAYSMINAEASRLAVLQLIEGLARIAKRSCSRKGAGLADDHST
jgi:transcriptional regulator with XRE-family HTH domain